MRLSVQAVATLRGSAQRDLSQAGLKRHFLLKRDGKCTAVNTPCGGGSRRAAAAQKSLMTPTYKLDRIDIKILAVLQRNGRITNVELADEVSLSPSPCLMRVKKLQQAGYITGYSAQIDLARLGPTLTVFTEFTLKNHRQIDFARFQRRLKT
jgi:hypothetical protein